MVNTDLIQFLQIRLLDGLLISILIYFCTIFRFLRTYAYVILTGHAITCDKPVSKCLALTIFLSIPIIKLKFRIKA